MDYDAYKSIHLAAADKPFELVREQNQLLQSAGMIFAVGPKLARSARDKLRGKADPVVVELIPGLPTVVPLEEQPSRFRAITVGRLSPRNDIIKQLPLAAVSFASAVGRNSAAFGRDASLTLLGISDDDLNTRHHEIVTLVEKHAGRLLSVAGVPYSDDHAALLDDVRRHSALMMLSIHEGFGLSGWEAIGAGIPLVVSVNSGLYEVIDRLFGGMGTGCLEAVDVFGSAERPYYKPRDVTAVRRALINIARRPERAKANAMTLRALVTHFCSWQHAATDFCGALSISTDTAAQELNLSRWTPAFLLDAMKAQDTAVDTATRRQLQYQVLWDRLSAPSKTKFVLLFGGVSSALIDEEAFRAYAAWLTSNLDCELFICYQSGRGALIRAGGINAEELASEPTIELRDPKRRMLEKVRKTQTFSKRLSELFLLQGKDVAARFHSIPLVSPLSTYVIVMDDDLYVTPLVHKRASETLSFTLARRSQFRRDTLNYMLYHFENAKQTRSTRKVLLALRRLSERHQGAE
jgi:hypothetical protein